MQLGCCTSIDHYDILEKLGADRISLSATDVTAMSPVMLENTAAKLCSGQIKCLDLNAYCPPEIVLCGSGYQLKKAIDYACILMPRAAKLGVKMIGVGAPKSRNLPLGFDRTLAWAQLSECLEQTCKIAADHGICMLLEAVCTAECNMITTTSEALKLVRQLSLPNLALVYDTYHAYMMREDFIPIEEAGDIIRVVHTAQEIDKHRYYLQANSRTEYIPYLNALVQGGYDGVISIEAFFGDFESGMADSLNILRQAIDNMVNL